MLDREVFSCIPFQLVLSQICSSLSFARNDFSLFCKNLFSGTEVWILRSKFFFREQLVLYTGFICSATSVRSIFDSYFLIKSFLTNPVGFLIFRIYVTAYLQNLWRYVDVRKHFFFLIKAKQCEVQRGTVTPGFERIYPGLLWCCWICHHS